MRGKRFNRRDKNKYKSRDEQDAANDQLDVFHGQSKARGDREVGASELDLYNNPIC